MSDDSKFTGCAIGAVGLLLVLVLLWFTSFKQVEAGHVGVITNFGAVQGGTISPGLHLVMPFVQDVKQIDTRVQAHQFQNIDAATKEYQQVTLTGKVNFAVDPQRAQELYQRVGEDFAAKLLDPAFQDFIKTVVPGYSINVVLLPDTRDAIRQATQDRLNAAVNQYGIRILAVQITDIHFSRQYEAAIEQKAVAQQQVAQAQQLLDKARIDAQTNEVLTQSATAQVLELKRIELQMKAIEKWDGKMPLSTSGNPLLQLPGTK